MHESAARSRVRRPRLVVAVAAAAAAALTAPFMWAPAPASAAEPAPAVVEQEAPTITAEQARQAHADFQAAGIPFEVIQTESGTSNLYHFPEGDFALAVPPEPGTVTPNLAVGGDSEGTYISFNNTDQRAIKTGATGALVIAIGALNPAVGIAAGLAVSIANEYIAGNGFCPSNDELWVYFTDGPTGPNYTQVVCRPVSHPGGG